jgi:hypothetical protein
MNVAPAETVRARHGLPLRLAVIVAAIALGLVAQHLLAEYLWQIEELSQTNLLEARALLARVLEVASVVVFGLTASLGVTLLVSMRRSFALARFPVSDLWSFGSRRQPVDGPQARAWARVGMALAIALILASCAGGALSWYIAAVLRACRAGVVTA